MTAYKLTNYVLLTIVFGYAVGVIIASRIPVSIAAIIGFFVVAIILFSLVFSLLKKNTILLLVPLAIIGLGIGMVRFQMADSDHGDAVLVEQNGKVVLLQGTIVRDPEFSNGTARFVLRAEKQDDVPLADPTRVLVSFATAHAFAYKDVVVVKGQLKKPEPFVGDNGKPFDYPAYLSKDAIYYQLRATDAVVTGQAGGTFLRALYGFKHHLLDSLSAVVPQPENGLMAGILLGTKEDISPEMRTAFVRTSTIHIIALSGYNISIIADACMQFFGLFFRIGVSTFFGIVSIILFTLMVGPSSTVVRAAIMGTLALISRRTGRAYDVSRALVIAGFLMIFIDPKTLVYDSSFALSFLATLGIIYLAPIFESKWTWLPRRWGIRALVCGTLAAECAVMPYLVYNMGTFSIIGLVANTLVLPLVPYTMLFGGVTAGVAMLSHYLAFPFAGVSKLFLSYIIHTIKYLSDLPFAALSLTDISIVPIVLIYAMLFWYVKKNQVIPVLE